jgi:hypothetical protein
LLLLNRKLNKEYGGIERYGRIYEESYKERR